jgi:hypothetical protein
MKIPITRISYEVCGALPDGHNRTPRENDHCECPEGWEGINCNGKCIIEASVFFVIIFTLYL